MKKIVTLEIWADETLKDMKECVDEVYNNIFNNDYISDGSADIRVVDADKEIKEYYNQKEDEEIAKVIEERDRLGDGTRYTFKEILKIK